MSYLFLSIMYLPGSFICVGFGSAMRVKMVIVHVCFNQNPFGLESFLANVHVSLWAFFVVGFGHVHNCCPQNCHLVETQNTDVPFNLGTNEAIVSDL